MSDGLGPITIELLLHFDRQAGYAAVIEISRQGERFELAPPCHLLALALDVALVLDLNLELLGDLRCGLRVGHQIGVAHTWLLEKLYGTPFFPSASAYHQTTQALLFVRDRIALAVECGPAPVIDQAKAAPRFRKAQVRVVLPKLKAVLGSAGKHPVGFGDAARNEIVDQHAKIGFIALRIPGGLVSREERRIQSGEKPLDCGLLVPRGAVDLAGEEQAAKRLRLERGVEVAWIEIVVLDGVSRPHDVSVLQPADRVHQVELNVERQTRGDAVRVELVRRQALRLDENLVARLAGEAVHLVLDGGAVARTDALDHAGKHGRAIEGPPDDFVCALIGVRDPARQLTGMHAALADEGKHGFGRITGLYFHDRKVNRAPVKPRWRAGFQAPDRQLELAQPGRERRRRRLAGAAGGVVRQSDMNQAGEKGACGEHHRARAELHAELRGDAYHALAFNEHIIHRLLEDHQVRLVFEPPTYRLPIEHPVGLRAGCAHGRTFGCIQRAELDASLIGSQCHGATERVDLLDEVSLADATDRGVAGHLPERLDAMGEKQRAASHARRSKRCLSAGVTAADHDDVELRRKFHGMRHFTRRGMPAAYTKLVSRGTSSVLQCSKYAWSR